MLAINVHPRRRRNRLGQTTMPALWRFTQKYQVNPETGCWEWTAHVGRWGYGDFRRGPGQHNEAAHRWSFGYFVRPLVKGEQVHHRCENPICVNPEHLEALTLDEHNARHGKRWAINKAKTHCIRGHALEGENLREYSPGQRTCKTCAALRAQARRDRDREAYRAHRRAYRARKRAERKVGAA